MLCQWSACVERVSDADGKLPVDDGFGIDARLYGLFFGNVFAQPVSNLKLNSFVPGLPLNLSRH